MTVGDKDEEGKERGASRRQETPNHATRSTRVGLFLCIYTQARVWAFLTLLHVLSHLHSSERRLTLFGGWS